MAQQFSKQNNDKRDFVTFWHIPLPPLTFWASLDMYLGVWLHSSKNYSLAHCAGVELGINFATFNLTMKYPLYR